MFIAMNRFQVAGFVTAKHVRINLVPGKPTG